LQEGQFERVGEERTRTVNVRIITATNRNLLEDSKKNLFRQDLYYRLSVFPIEIPPLRERIDDIEPLAMHFADYYCNQKGYSCSRLTKADIRSLERYDWPGNIRELQNVIERAILLAKGGRLHFEFADTSRAHAARLPINVQETTNLTLDELKEMERKILIDALDETDWKIYGNGGAAERLDLKPTTLASRIKKFGIQKHK